LRIPRHIAFVFLIYASGIAIFTLFRVLLLGVQHEQIEIIQNNRLDILLQALLMGFRFDTVISGYVLMLPLLVLSIVSVIGKDGKVAYLASTIFVLPLYALSFLVSSVDIPYYNHFHARLTTVALTWIDTPTFVLGMIFQEWKYGGYIIPFAISVFLFSFLLVRIYRAITAKDDRARLGPGHGIRTGLFSIVCLGLLFLGIRGRIAEKSPIRVGTAYFSDYAFINHLGLNPVFTFVRGYLDDLDPENAHIVLMDEAKAIELVQDYLGVPRRSEFKSPIARRRTFSDTSLRPNVVIILMESITANYLQRYRSREKLMPYLDSLMGHSIVFDNFYSAGIHTFNGVYATVVSYPSLLRKHPMKGTEMPKYDGLATSLKRNGYTSIYFTTHDEQFDNIGGFLKNNDFDQVVSQKDYPSREVMSTLGVPDHRMFEYSIPILSQLHQAARPFLAVFLTASNHGPFIVPADIPFTSCFPEKEKKTIEYTDWSLRYFLEHASEHDWYRNTLFVITSDHGASVDNTYEMSLSYHHIPFVIFAPVLQKRNGYYDCLGGQLDIFPTIMGLLGVSYTNNTLGIDLLRENQPFIYMCADDDVGVLDHEFFLVMKNTGAIDLYKYGKSELRNYSSEHPALVDSMKNYVCSMMQTADYLIRHRLVGGEHGPPPSR